MSSRYTADGKRRSSMTHATRAYTCSGQDGCGKVVHGNGARSSHRAAHERKGEKVFLRHWRYEDGLR